MGRFEVAALHLHAHATSPTSPGNPRTSSDPSHRRSVRAAAEHRLGLQIKFDRQAIFFISAFRRRFLELLFLDLVMFLDSCLLTQFYFQVRLTLQCPDFTFLFGLLNHSASARARARVCLFINHHLLGLLHTVHKFCLSKFCSF